MCFDAVVACLPVFDPRSAVCTYLTSNTVSIQTAHLTNKPIVAALWSLLPCCATAWDALVYPKNIVAALQATLLGPCIWCLHMSLVDSSMEPAALLACINPRLLPLLYA
jgi:hypothetical protein